MIIRQWSKTVSFIQLDDLPPESLVNIQPPSSARRREDIKAREAARRLAGTFNFKPHYAPEFPLVAID